MPYHDNAIRVLTIEDAKNIEICCSPDLGDNQIGKNISEEFLNHYKEFLKSPHITNLGLFINDQLTGFVQAFSQKDLGLSTINIFVNRAYRKNGYAKRLLSAMCATSPGNVYCYSCVKTNIASIHTAQTCGFELKGAYLFI